MVCLSKHSMFHFICSKTDSQRQPKVTYLCCKLRYIFLQKACMRGIQELRLSPFSVGSCGGFLNTLLFYASRSIAQQPLRSQYLNCLYFLSTCLQEGLTPRDFNGCISTPGKRNEEERWIHLKCYSDRWPTHCSWLLMSTLTWSEAWRIFSRQSRS